MSIHINFLAVLLAGLSSMVIGTIYYADGVFGKAWKDLSKVDVKKFEKNFPKLLPLILLAALLSAFIMAHFIYLAHAFYGYSWLSSGVITSLWAWLGFSATTIVIHSVMDLKPTKLIMTSVGNRFFSLLAMGLILGWLHP